MNISPDNFSSDKLCSVGIAPTGLHRRVRLGIILLELFCLCLAIYLVYTFFLPGGAYGGAHYHTTPDPWVTLPTRGVPATE